MNSAPPSAAQAASAAREPDMQRTIISIAVHFACIQIGREWAARQQQKQVA